MRLHIPIVALTVLGTSVSAFGQILSNSSMQAAAQNAARQESTGPVRRLSIDEAVKLALEQNLGIRIQRIDPQIQDVSVAAARSFWAPNLQSSFSRNSQTQQSTSSLAG